MHVKIHETAIETTINTESLHIYEHNFCKCDDHIYADVIKIIQVTQDHK
jgi:hypothetical protein